MRVFSFSIMMIRNHIITEKLWLSERLLHAIVDWHFLSIHALNFNSRAAYVRHVFATTSLGKIFQISLLLFSLKSFRLHFSLMYFAGFQPLLGQSLLLRVNMKFSVRIIVLAIVMNSLPTNYANLRRCFTLSCKVIRSVCV